MLVQVPKYEGFGIGGEDNVDDNKLSSYIHHHHHNYQPSHHIIIIVTTWERSGQERCGDRNPLKYEGFSLDLSGAHSRFAFTFGKYLILKEIRK